MDSLAFIWGTLRDLLSDASHSLYIYKVSNYISRLKILVYHMFPHYHSLQPIYAF